MRPFRAVCFDLGGVLIQIHHTWDGAVKAARVSEARADIGPLGGFETFEQYQDGRVGREEYLDSLRDYLGVSSVDEAHKVHMAILREPYPGVGDIVRELSDAGYAIGCLSNTSESHWQTFFEGGNYAFGPLLKIRIGSHRVRASKPNHEIYRAFELESGCQGYEVVYFDDSPQNVESALSLGWQACLIDPAGDTARQIRQRLQS